jgi:hypothetical protein
MTVIKIDNDPESFLQVITQIRTINPSLAFISYLDGEYGFRVILFNSLVYQFSQLQRKLKNPIVGLCFIGNTFFLKHYCDIIIEVQDVAFKWDAFDTQTPEQLAKRNHMPLNLPYAGNDAGHYFYKLGYTNTRYEEILLNLKFSNIFFTYHSAGSWQTTGEINNIQTAPYISDLYVGKINNNYYKLVDTALTNTMNEFIDHLNYAFIKLTSFSNFKKNTEKNDIIVTWVRKSNTVEANMPEDIYLALFEYCIQHKKHLYVFLDINKVSVPENEYLHVCDYRKNNSPLFDEFVKICNKAYLYVGCDSGSSYIASYYTKANCLLYNQQWKYTAIINQLPVFTTKQELITMLDSKYN